RQRVRGWPTGRGRRPTMSAVESPEPQLAFHLRRLRLSGILDTLEVRTQQAIAEHWSYAEFLTRLVQDEAERREHKALGLRLRRARRLQHRQTTGQLSGARPAGHR